MAADTDIVELPYDWRQDPVETVHALEALIRRMRAGGARPVSLVAHSFGGYIVAYYLRYGAQDPEAARETWEGAEQVEKVIVMGTPFLGAMLKFRDMLTGETVELNTSLLDATAHASFPSSYFLIPAPYSYRRTVIRFPARYTVPQPGAMNNGASLRRPMGCRHCCITLGSRSSPRICIGAHGSPASLMRHQGAYRRSP